MLENYLIVNQLYYKLSYIRLKIWSIFSDNIIINEYKNPKEKYISNLVELGSVNKLTIDFS